MTLSRLNYSRGGVIKRFEIFLFTHRLEDIEKRQMKVKIQTANSLNLKFIARVCIAANVKFGLPD